MGIIDCGVQWLGLVVYISDGVHDEMKMCQIDDWVSRRMHFKLSSTQL